MNYSEDGAPDMMKIEFIVLYFISSHNISERERRKGILFSLSRTPFGCHPSNHITKMNLFRLYALLFKNLGLDLGGNPQVGI